MEQSFIEPDNAEIPSTPENDKWIAIFEDVERNEDGNITYKNFYEAAMKVNQSSVDEEEFHDAEENENVEENIGENMFDPDDIKPLELVDYGKYDTLHQDDDEEALGKYNTTNCEPMTLITQSKLFA